MVLILDIDKDNFVFYIYHVFSVQCSELNLMKPELNHVFLYKCCYALYNIYVVPLIQGTQYSAKNLIEYTAKFILYQNNVYSIFPLYIKGASSDFKTATSIAKQMVMYYGMSENVSLQTEQVYKIKSVTSATRYSKIVYVQLHALKM